MPLLPIWICPAALYYPLPSPVFASPSFTYNHRYPLASSRTSLPSRSVHRSPSPRQPNTPAFRCSRFEHGRVPIRDKYVSLRIVIFLVPYIAIGLHGTPSSVPQHIRHDKKPDMAPSNVNLIQMAYAPIARGNGDVFELDVHVVFGYWKLVGKFLGRKILRRERRRRRQEGLSGVKRLRRGGKYLREACPGRLDRR